MLHLKGNRIFSRAIKNRDSKYITTGKNKNLVKRANMRRYTKQSTGKA
jgi:hypothetical protein